MVAQAGPGEPAPVAAFYRPVGMLLAVMGFAAFAAGLAGYGLTRGGFICWRVWNTLGRPMAIALLPRGRAATVRAGLIVLAGAAVWWWRWRAR